MQPIRLCHADGSEWTVSMVETEVTTVMRRAGRDSSRTRTFGSAAAAQAWVKEGRAQMEKAGFFEPGSEAASRHAECEAFIASLAAGIPHVPAMARLVAVWHSPRVQTDIDHLLKDGDEGALTAFRPFPLASEALIRTAATAKEAWQHDLSAWIAVMTHSPLLVSLIKLERLRTPNGPSVEVEHLPLGGLLWGSHYTAVELLVEALEDAPTARDLTALYEHISERPAALPPGLEPLRVALAEVERELSRAAATSPASGAGARKFYHGTRAHLSPGDLIQAVKAGIAGLKPLDDG